MAPSILDVRHLTKSFSRSSERAVVQDVSFEIEPGCVYALLGRNGAGKTTIIKSIMGLYHDYVGEIEVFGISARHGGDRLRRLIGYIPESPVFYPWMSVCELIHFVRRFYKNWDHSFCLELLEEYDLPLEKRISELSKGTVARLALVLAISHRPELLILDDPTLGLDTIARQQFIEGMIRYIHDTSAGALVASHNLPEVERIVDRVGFLSQGKLLCEAPLETLREEFKLLSFPVETQDEEIKRLIPCVLRISKRLGRPVALVRCQNGQKEEQTMRAFPLACQRQDLDLEEIFVELLQP